MSDVEIEQLRDVRFSTAFPGYNRKQVDDYLTRANRILAELQITASPESAIRHALAQVAEETRSLIEGAQRTAEEITTGSKAEADERLERAEQEAQQQKDAGEEEARRLTDTAAQEAKRVREVAAQEASEVREVAQRETTELREAAEARVRELVADAQAIAAERTRLIGGLRDLTRGLDAYLDEAESRLRESEPREPEGQDEA